MSHRITNIRVELGATVNLGNYESSRVGIAVDVEVDHESSMNNDTNALDANDKARRFARRMLTEELERIISTDNPHVRSLRQQLTDAERSNNERVARFVDSDR